VGDIDWDNSRLILPRGNGNKRNGMCYLPRAFLPEIRAYLSARGNPTADQPLILSSTGEKGDPIKFAKNFTALLIYTFVKQAWPAADPRTKLVDPLEVAYRIYHRRIRGFDGAPPTNPAKIALRMERTKAVETLQADLAPGVAAAMVGHDMYALKTTHITWARRLSNADSVRSQVGHAGQDVEERYYLDMNLVNAKESPEAVWDVLTGARTLEGGRNLAPSVPVNELAAGA
jgi:integrase